MSNDALVHLNMLAFPLKVGGRFYPTFARSAAPFPSDTAQKWENLTAKLFCLMLVLRAPHRSSGRMAESAGLFLFVSHVREDEAAASEVVDELERRGIRCWIAPRDVNPGQPFDDEIVAAIEASRAVLLIFSDRCNDSQYIRREVTVAGESQKVIIPFRIEDAQPRRGLRVRLPDLHWVDAFVSRERAIDQVVRTIHRTETPEQRQQGQRQTDEEQAREPETPIEHRRGPRGDPDGKEGIRPPEGDASEGDKASRLPNPEAKTDAAPPTTTPNGVAHDTVDVNPISIVPSTPEPRAEQAEQSRPRLSPFVYIAIAGLFAFIVVIFVVVHESTKLNVVSD
jgi:hypothetical protein